MGWLIRFSTSSIGAKMLMAVTGLVLVLFVFGHMLGNLQVFAGAEALNSYAAALQGAPGLLWPVRVILAAAVLLHAVAAVSLALGNRAARPVKYVRRQHRATSYAARTMIWGGLAVALFVGYHLAHFTLLVTHPDYHHLVDARGRHDVYAMVILGFQSAPIALLYVAAVAALCVHLSHGIPSFLQTLGLRHPKLTPAVETFGPALALVLFLGMAAVPAAVQIGWLTLAGGA
jgi:succinate dehydrogenase / fumarate reductase cytochrome b subunit